MTDEPEMAKTWEECARHVEAGGVVQWRGPDGKWRDDVIPAASFRARTGTPGDGWNRPRRLLPIEAPIDPTMKPGPEVDGRPTWYGTARDAEVAGMTEGRCWTKYKWIHVGDLDAAAIVQARYPLPPSKPKTVRVHWSVADGREDPHDGEIVRVEKSPGWMPRVNFAGDGWMDVTSPDGTVEVLAKEDES